MPLHRPTRCGCASAMHAERDAQIEALLQGDAYAWAVRNGRIRAGEPLHMSRVFSVTRGEVVEYLRTHPVPGLDVRQEQYRGSTDGPKLLRQAGACLIGWQERGIFHPEHVVRTEAAARETWIHFLAAALGLAR